jgi:hypothetical protein
MIFGKGGLDGGGLAVESDFYGFGRVAWRKNGAYALDNVGRKVEVVGSAGFFVVEVGVRLEVSAVAGRAALEVHLTDEIALHEGFEAVVNGGKGDRGHLGANASVHFVGGGVIAFLQESAINHLALRGIAQPAAREALS